MNGTFLRPTDTPGGPSAAGLLADAILPMVRQELGFPGRAGRLPAERPEVLLARSLRRQVERLGRLTPQQRANLARDHGLALGALCGLRCRELADGADLDASTVRRIVARVCAEAGIARGPDGDG